MSALRRSVNDPWLAALVGILLLIVSLACVWRSMRAGMAQEFYRRAKYGQPESDTELVLELCRKAYVLYPDNYCFSILAAEKAYYTAALAGTVVKRRRMEQSAVWCERGLVQNWWKGQLRRLKTRFLWVESPSAAIRFWTAYTEWQFWEPYNHAVLAEMFAGVGDFENADRELCWAGRTADGERARHVVDKEKQEWNEILSGAGKGWGE